MKDMVSGQAGAIRETSYKVTPNAPAEEAACLLFLNNNRVALSVNVVSCRGREGAIVGWLNLSSGRLVCVSSL